MCVIVAMMLSNVVLDCVHTEGKGPVTNSLVYNAYQGHCGHRGNLPQLVIELFIMVFYYMYTKSNLFFYIKLQIKQDISGEMVLFHNVAKRGN